MKKNILAVLLATIWISISEFVRNEFILQSFWLRHYDKMGLIFPNATINGAIWGLWSLCLAIGVLFLSKKFSLLETTLLSWFFGFVFMWLVTGNLGVLPVGILPYAIPLSFLEAFLAALIIKKVTHQH